MTILDVIVDLEHEKILALKSDLYEGKHDKAYIHLNEYQQMLRMHYNWFVTPFIF